MFFVQCSHVLPKLSIDYQQYGQLRTGSMVNTKQLRNCPRLSSNAVILRKSVEDQLSSFQAEQ